MTRLEDCNEWPVAQFTIDGVPVTRGLRVWDYDLNLGTVTGVTHVEPLREGQTVATVWFQVTRDKGGASMMDGSRLWTRDPSTGEPAPPLSTRKSACYGCSTKDNPVEGSVEVPGRKGLYCEDCAVQRRTHAYRSPTALTALCGAVIRWQDPRLRGERPPRVEADAPHTTLEVAPDACPDCLLEVWDRAWS